MNKTIKSKVETEISQAMAKLLEQKMGEYASTVTTEALVDTIIVRFKGILPPAEKVLIKNYEGLKLIKELKEKLIEKARPSMEIMIKTITGIEVEDVYSSFNAEENERIEVFTLKERLEE
ncbi:MAG: DUF2294 family protein [Endomicrobiales bacterium]|nr:DUF2294 family protein [Endomicrobiales bacterium]